MGFVKEIQNNIFYLSYFIDQFYSKFELINGTIKQTSSLEVIFQKYIYISQNLWLLLNVCSK